METSTKEKKENILQVEGRGRVLTTTFPFFF